jgi:hypothetical protein
LAVTLQKKLELAGDLAKVQPLLQRLRIVEKPKERHGVRNVVLVSGVIGAVTLALAVVAVLRRRARLDAVIADEADYARADSPNGEAVPVLGDPLSL